MKCLHSNWIKIAYDVVTLRYIYGHVTYTGMLHIHVIQMTPPQLHPQLIPCRITPSVTLSTF